MNYPESKIGIILVGQTIESHSVLNNALSHLGLDISLKYFFEVSKAIQYLKSVPDYKPDMIFLEPEKNDNCLGAVAQIRALHQFDSVSLVLYNSALLTLDCEEIFAKGANAYIRKQDFTGLKKMLRHVIGIDHQFHAGNMNRETYMLSL